MFRTLKQILSMSGLFLIWFQTLVFIEDIADHEDNELFFMKNDNFVNNVEMNFSQNNWLCSLT